jgi:hypothetical protein
MRGGKSKEIAEGRETSNNDPQPVREDKAGGESAAKRDVSGEKHVHVSDEKSTTATTTSQMSPRGEKGSSAFAKARKFTSNAAFG